MAVLAVFGIENDGLNLAVNLLLLFLVVIWLALVYWTWADARRRIADPMLVGCATAAALFPFIGTIVYLIVRPPEFLDDVRERELEMAAAQARLAALDQLQCPHCGFDVEKAFLRCPSCLRRLKEPCTRVREAARPALEDLPLLRGGGGPGSGRAPAPAGPAERCSLTAGAEPPAAPVAAPGRQRRGHREQRQAASRATHARGPRAPAVDPPRHTPTDPIGDAWTGP